VELSNEPDPQTRVSENDLVGRLEADAARPSRNRDAPSVSDDARPMFAAVIVQAKAPGDWLVRNVCMPAGDALIDVARSLEECHVVGSNEPVPAVAHLGTSADVDTSRCRKHIRAPLRGTVEHRHLDARRGRISPGNPPLRPRHSGELDVEFRSPPGFPWPALVVHREVEVVDGTSRESEVGDDTVAQRRTVGDYGLEASTGIARRREDRQRDGVEWKDPPASATRLNLLLGRFDDRVNDLERLARTGSDESSNRAIECASELRFEVPGPSQKIHIHHFPISPAAAAALTISPAAGAAVMPP
jgi:hypothetical protein